MTAPRSNWWGGGGGGGLPGLDVLRHDAPSQVIIAVIPSWVVKEVRP